MSQLTKKVLSLALSGLILLPLSLQAAAPEGTGTITATLRVVGRYTVTTSNLDFGEQMAADSTVTVTPGSPGAASVIIQGDSEAAEVEASLANSGEFTLEGESSGQTISGKAFFSGQGEPSSTTVAMQPDQSGRSGDTSVGGSVTLSSSTTHDTYRGSITVNVVQV